MMSLMKKTMMTSGTSFVTPAAENEQFMFEFQADDPQAQQMTPLRRKGTGQLLSNGSFCFTGDKRRARKNLLLRKAAHGRLSATLDHAKQLTLKVFDSEAIDWQAAFLRETVGLLTSLMGVEPMRELLNEVSNSLNTEKVW